MAHNAPATLDHHLAEAQYTPMMQQYLAIKKEVPDAFLFFRLGDFYELFFEDAILASRELEITLTGRDAGVEERVPMCGVPYHSVDNYIAKLIEKGYKVAICEQVEDPKSAKGVVRREIIRIVTPGTVMESNSLAESANNYIAALAEEGEQFGIAICDLSTGELHVTSVPATAENLADELNAFMPSELLGDARLLNRAEAVLSAFSRRAVATEWTAERAELLQAHFAAPQLAPLNEAKRRAVCLLISYLHETQKRSLDHIRHIRVYEPQHYMVLDPFTRRNLELTETIRDRAKTGSLLWLLDRTVTSMGGRLLKRWVDKPLLSAERITKRLNAVDYLFHNLIAREELRQALKEVYDLERLAGRVAFGTANARDLLALKLSLRQIPGIMRLCRESGCQTLIALVADLDDCADIADWIEAAIVDDPPVSVRDGGMIKPGYNAYLDKLKEASAGGKQWIAQLEKQERELTGIKSLKLGFNKVFGYYIEVTKANLAQLPEGRYERKQTLANAERFVTKELKEKESLILEAEEKMVDLEYELFVELRQQIAGQIARLQRLGAAVAEVDAYQSLAEASVAGRFVRPEIAADDALMIVEGRHPVVEAVLTNGKFVGNDTRLNHEDGSIMLITGPNMAGKSTYMRQVALIVIMAQIGCFVPAQKATVPLIDRIFTRIGAADDLVGGQSTFMVEMKDIQTMTEKATGKSLVIIDELGRGTSTGEGMAIAQAVIEYLHDHIGCKTLVSTHFHELAHLEQSLPQLRNYRMAVREDDGNVTFLRKLVKGAADTSYGIYCARIAGLPESLIERAYQILQQYAGAKSAASRETFAKAPENAAEEVVQMSWFVGQEDAQAPHKGKPKKGKEANIDSHALKTLEKLKALDLMNMTPLQAMNVLYELKQQICLKI
ncbi:MAG TPA: DNA mismatch repair protein MutS [Bacilli bacterium]